MTSDSRGSTETGCNGTTYKLHEGIADNAAWQGWWHDLAVMPYQIYDTRSGKFGRRFVGALAEEL